MDLNYKTVNIFPVPVHQFDVNGFSEIQDELIDYAYSVQKLNPIGESISNHGGWQSTSFSIVNEDNILHKFLINCLAEFPVIKKSVDIKVEAWININKPGDYNVMHQHPSCDLSGVLWIKSHKDCGVIEFQSPVEFQTYDEIESYTEEFKHFNNYNHNYCFNPIEGRILVFPSHLRHQVKENKSKENRISVSFNILLDK